MISSLKKTHVIVAQGNIICIWSQYYLVDEGQKSWKPSSSYSLEESKLRIREFTEYFSSEWITLQVNKWNAWYLLFGHKKTIFSGPWLKEPNWNDKARASFRSNCPERFCKKYFLKNFAGKRMYLGLFIKKCLFIQETPTHLLFCGVYKTARRTSGNNCIWSFRLAILN